MQLQLLWLDANYAYCGDHFACKQISNYYISTKTKKNMALKNNSVRNFLNTSHFLFCIFLKRVSPNNVKPHLSGIKGEELWRSGFLNNKHSAIHLPGVEVLSLLPTRFPSSTLHCLAGPSFMVSQPPGLKGSM